MGPEDLAKLGAAGVAALSLMTAGAVPKLHEKKASAWLVSLDPFNDQPYYPGLRFQYYPASISDTKAVNYSQKAVPGGSLPLYQWINGGERIISFTAMFSSDIDLSLASDAIGAGSLVDEVKANGVEDRNVDIVAAVLWLRSMMMPVYTSHETVHTLPPPKLYLNLPNTGIWASGGVSEHHLASAQIVLCLMTQCDVEYKAFFPSGVPRLVSVQLSFAEIPQQGGKVSFPGDYWEPTRDSSSIQNAIKEGILFQGGYNLRPKW